MIKRKLLQLQYLSPKDQTFTRGIFVLSREHPVYSGVLKGFPDSFSVLLLALGCSLAKKGWTDRVFQRHEYKAGLPDKDLLFVPFDRLRASDLKQLSFVLDHWEIPHLYKFSEETIESMPYAPSFSRLEFWGGGTDNRLIDSNILRGHINNCFVAWLKLDQSQMSSLKDVSWFKHFSSLRRSRRFLKTLGIESKESEI